VLAKLRAGFLDRGGRGEVDANRQDLGLLRRFAGIRRGVALELAHAREQADGLLSEPGEDRVTDPAV